MNNLKKLKGNMILKPLVFVAMPFGIKIKDGRTKIDFDYLYEKAIKPIKDRIEVDIIRADEEKYGGFIHLPMYERLLLAEIVVADLTLANPNVFYELGVRHCARPKSTILIFAEGMNLPFDVSHLRVIPYKLDKGKISDFEAQKLQKNIEDRIIDAISEKTGPDSPLFQLIEKFPGIDLPHEVTESFRNRVKYIDSIRLELESARNQSDLLKGKEKIKEIENKIGDLSLAPDELLIDLVLSYRDVSAWNDMVRVISRFPDKIKNLITVQEQLAFALNRRNKQGDRNKAIAILKNLLSKYGNSPETCGILGRIYKDIYTNTKKANRQSEARGALNESIKYYTLGFEEDPRDYYPGINAITLLLERGDEESNEEIKRLYPLVSFAVSRRGGLNSDDYWDIATVLELSLIGKDWQLARQSADKLLLIGKAYWNFETTHRNIKMIRDKFKEREKGLQIFDSIIKDLERKMLSLKQEIKGRE